MKNSSVDVSVRKTQQQFKMLAMSGLVCSVISLFVLWFLAIAGVALSTRAYMMASRTSIAEWPQAGRYRTMAAIGMIVGAVSFVGWLYMASK